MTRLLIHKLYLQGEGFIGCKPEMEARLIPFYEHRLKDNPPESKARHWKRVTCTKCLDTKGKHPYEIRR